MSTISLIVAAASNGVIGGDNKLLWHISEDLKRFKALTTGKPVIMGRKTFDSIGRPLPNRPNIVVSRQAGLDIPGVTVTSSLEEAIKTAKTLGSEEIMVIGGATLYAQALPFATSVYLTRIHKAYDGDVRFPDLSLEEWREIERIKGAGTLEAEYDFVTYKRI